MVATDRISAFDYVLGSGIPDKGKVLTQLSAFWFEQTRGIVPNTASRPTSREYPGRHARPTPTMLRGRSMLVRKTEPMPIECVARGYLSGSGWKEYQRDRQRVRRAAAGGTARIGSTARSRSSRPRRKRRAATTSTSARLKPAASSATELDRDAARADAARSTHVGAAHAESRGIILADTKFEFGAARGDRRAACSSTKR